MQEMKTTFNRLLKQLERLTGSLNLDQVAGGKEGLVCGGFTVYWPLHYDEKLNQMG